MEKSNNLNFVIFIFEISKFRNIGHSTFGRSKFWPPEFRVFLLLFISKIDEKASREFQFTFFLISLSGNKFFSASTGNKNCLIISLFVHFGVSVNFFIDSPLIRIRKYLLNLCFRRIFVQLLRVWVDIWNNQPLPCMVDAGMRWVAAWGIGYRVESLRRLENNNIGAEQDGCQQRRREFSHAVTGLGWEAFATLYVYTFYFYSAFSCTNIIQ